MQFALTDGERREASPKRRARCPVCDREVLAKCGSKRLHHWAHAIDASCDPWWENETAWHREWKNRFPAEWREIAATDASGEVHRADVKTPLGITIEFQNSPMTDAELASRELFYGNLIWVLNGKPFQKQFHILHVLPDPQSEFARDAIWMRANRIGNHGVFWRPSENPDHRPGERGMVQVQSLFRFEEEILASYVGHHQFDWVRPLTGWIAATCPVFIDFGDDYLWKMEIYDEHGLRCIRAVPKGLFMRDAQSLTEAALVGHANLRRDQQAK